MRSSIPTIKKRFFAPEEVFESQSLLNEVKYSNHIKKRFFDPQLLLESQSLLNEVKYSNEVVLDDDNKHKTSRNPF